MKLFLDECVSPRVAKDLMAEDGHYIVHPLLQGGRGHGDHTVLARCIDEDLVLVTVNARDFRALASRSEIHPGMIMLPCVSKDRSKVLLRGAIEYLETLGDPSNFMVNKVLEVHEAGSFQLYDLPEE